MSAETPPAWQPLWLPLLATIAGIAAVRITHRPSAEGVTFDAFDGTDEETANLVGDRSRAAVPVASELPEDEASAPYATALRDHIATQLANPPALVVPVPPTVSRRQLLLVLNSLGVTRAAIRAQIGANEAALIEFDEASSFDREHALVGQLATALGLNSGQVDDIFRNAIQL